MRDTNNVDESRDLSTNREVLLSNGNKYHIQQPPSCPHGYWYIHMDSGQVPEKLKGAYTTFKKALAAVSAYVEPSNKKIKAVKE